MSKLPRCIHKSHKSTPSSDQAYAIRVHDLHKSFRLPTERAAGLKQAIFNWLKGVKGYTEQQVLRGVSFDIRPGSLSVLLVAMAPVNLPSSNASPRSIIQSREVLRSTVPWFRSSSWVWDSIPSSLVAKTFI